MDKHWLALLQLCDSNLPTGAFSHSFGLETYMQEGKVANKQTFASWLEVYIREQLVYCDGLACRLVFEALQDQQFETIWSIDRIMIAQILPREAREASQRMGERLIKLVNAIYECPILKKYEQRLQSKQSFGHSSIAFAMIAHHIGASKQQAILSYLFSSITSLIQNGVRGIPLGQTEGQQLIHDMRGALWKALETIETLELDDLGIVSPGLELSQMKHERLHVRLFMS